MVMSNSRTGPSLLTGSRGILIEIMTIFLIFIGILIFLPLGYIYSFLLVELPRRVGYFKFILILLGYVISFGVIVCLLSGGYLNSLLFLIFPTLACLLGVYCLRKEFMISIKKDFGFTKKHS